MHYLVYISYLWLSDSFWLRIVPFVIYAKCEFIENSRKGDKRYFIVARFSPKSEMVLGNQMFVVALRQSHFSKS